MVGYSKSEPRCASGQGHVSSNNYLIEPIRSATFNTYHAAGVSRQQVKHFTIFKKMSKLLNFITIFGIAMENALK